MTPPEEAGVEPPMTATEEVAHVSSRRFAPGVAARSVVAAAIPFSDAGLEMREIGSRGRGAALFWFLLRYDHIICVQRWVKLRRLGVTTAVPMPSSSLSHLESAMAECRCCFCDELASGVL